MYKFLGRKLLRWLGMNGWFDFLGVDDLNKTSKLQTPKRTSERYILKFQILVCLYAITRVTCLDLL